MGVLVGVMVGVFMEVLMGVLVVIRVINYHANNYNCDCVSSVNIAVFPMCGMRQPFSLYAAFSARSATMDY